MGLTKNPLWVRITIMENVQFRDRALGRRPPNQFPCAPNMYIMNLTIMADVQGFQGSRDPGHTNEPHDPQVPTPATMWPLWHSPNVHRNSAGNQLATFFFLRELLIKTALIMYLPLIPLKSDILRG